MPELDLPPRRRETTVSSFLIYFLIRDGGPEWSEDRVRCFEELVGSKCGANAVAQLPPYNTERELDL